ncbi:MAG: hypothetical protein AAF431_19820, partial [Pseudomonadota bacterium]
EKKSNDKLSNSEGVCTKRQKPLNINKRSQTLPNFKSQIVRITSTTYTLLGQSFQRCLEQIPFHAAGLSCGHRVGWWKKFFQQSLSASLQRFPYGA